MIALPAGHPRTKLTDSEYKRCLKVVERSLRTNQSIRNRELREATGMNYDQAIAFFKRATSERRLVRRGSAGGTRYVLATQSEAFPSTGNEYPKKSQARFSGKHS
jgi:hypothetical protein